MHAGQSFPLLGVKSLQWVPSWFWVALVIPLQHLLESHQQCKNEGKLPYIGNLALTTFMARWTSVANRSEKESAF